jgi:hypothetical protein
MRSNAEHMCQSQEVQFRWYSRKVQSIAGVETTVSHPLRIERLSSVSAD